MAGQVVVVEEAHLEHGEVGAHAQVRDRREANELETHKQIRFLFNLVKAGHLTLEWVLVL